MQLQKRLPEWLEWLFSTPWYVPTVAMIVLIFLVMYLCLPRKGEAQASTVSMPQAQEQPDEPTSGKIYEGAHHDLMVFVNDHLLETVELVFQIREQIVDMACEHEAIRGYAKTGMRAAPDSPELLQAYNTLIQLSGSPPQYIKLDQMIKYVVAIEKNFSKFVEETKKLFNLRGFH